MKNNTVYNSIAELPNRRGEYIVNAQFADCKEVCRVTIDFDVDMETDEPIKSAYCYMVDSLDRNHLYTAAFGFSSVRNTIAECHAKTKEVR
jgi:hypothetical protein